MQLRLRLIPPTVDCDYSANVSDKLQVDLPMKKLRVGVVGVGAIGSNHARLYEEIPSAEFTAVSDIDVTKGNAIGSNFGATPAQSLDEFSAAVHATSVARRPNEH